MMRRARAKSCLPSPVELLLQLATRSAYKRDLYSQALAAFCTACVQNLTAATGSHTGAEAVGALATHNGRLVSTFHVGLAKKYKIGTGDVPKNVGANDISRTAPISLPAKIRASYLKNHGLRAGNPGLSGFLGLMSTIKPVNRCQPRRV